MNLQTAADVPLLITVPSSTSKDAPPQLSAERRINPSWTVSQLKAKLEPITGIPPGSQDLRIRALDGSWTSITGDARRVGGWSLRRGGEIEIHDTRPPSSRPTTLDPAVEKYTMPVSQYETLTDSVLHWKRTHHLGRFDGTPRPSRGGNQDETEIIRRRGIEVGKRCRVRGDDARRGTVAFVGEVEGLGGEGERGARWVGVRYDEPVGRNDGSVAVTTDGDGGREMRRLFECGPGFGVVVRPEMVEVGDEWVPLDDLPVDGDMEEL